MGYGVSGFNLFFIELFVDKHPRGLWSLPTFGLLRFLCFFKVIFIVGLILLFQLLRQVSDIYILSFACFFRFHLSLVQIVVDIFRSIYLPYLHL